MNRVREKVTIGIHAYVDGKIMATYNSPILPSFNKKPPAIITVNKTELYACTYDS